MNYLQAPHFKEMCLASQQSIKVVADLKKTETELFDYLAEKDPIFSAR